VDTVTFLGVAMPRLGTSEEELRSAHFFPTDLSVHQNDDEVVFSRHFDSSLVGSVLVTAVVRLKKVTSIGMVTVVPSPLLTEQIQRQPQCDKRSEASFSCRIGSDETPVTVVICGQFVALFPNSPASVAQSARFCGIPVNDFAARSQQVGLLESNMMAVALCLLAAGIALVLFLLRRGVRGRQRVDKR
jgi:hypothetical protein